MSVRALVFTLTGAIMIATTSAFAQPQPKTIGRIIRDDPALDNLIALDAQIEVLASGFTWSEGPVWVKNGGFLLFSDIPRNSVMKWKEGEGISLFLHPSGYTGNTFYGKEPGSNALTIDAQGRLTLCQHGDRRVARLEPGGGMRTVVDNYLGKRLNSPNDLCFKSNGDLYFTDPPYGLPFHFEDPRRELDYCGVYRFSKDGKLTLLTKELSRPNGLAFSPDEKTLYVAVSDPAKAIIMAYSVKADGTLGTGKLFADETDLVVQKLPGLPDGMKVDRDGNLFATGPGGVHIFDKNGKRLGRIETGERTANCAWGEDGTTLFICADMYICRVRTKTKGAGW